MTTKRKSCSCIYTCPASDTCKDGKVCAIKEVYSIARKHEYCDKLLDEIACYGFVLIRLHGLNTFYTIHKNDITHRELQSEKMKYAEMLDEYLVQKRVDKSFEKLTTQNKNYAQIENYSGLITEGGNQYV